MISIRKLTAVVLLPAAVAGLFALGCGIAATIFTGVAATANGGGGGGGTNKSARITVSSTLDLSTAVMVGGSPNIMGPPQIIPLAPGEWQVVVALNDVPDGDQVHLTLAVQSPSVPDGELHVKRFVFYPVPPSQLPSVDPQPFPDGMDFAWRMDAQLGMVLDATNPATEPASLILEGAESSVVFSGPQVYYDGLGNVSWQPLANTVVGPQQTVTIDLPDSAGDPPLPAALLLRYVTTVSSIVQKGACQVELTGPVASAQSTWGRIKALYR